MSFFITASLSNSYFSPEGAVHPPSFLWSLPTSTWPHPCFWIQSTMLVRILLILIFYFFLFKNRGVFSLYLPQSLTKPSCNSFVYWMSKNTAISDIQTVHILAKKTFYSRGDNLAIFQAFNSLRQVLLGGHCWPQRSITLNDFGSVLQEAMKRHLFLDVSALFR